MESIFRRDPDGEPILYYYCDNCCKPEVSGPFYYCKSCPNTGVCSECYELRSRNDHSPGCKVEHEHIALGGEEWISLRYSVVNSDKDTLKEFIRKLKENPR